MIRIQSERILRTPGTLRNELRNFRCTAVERQKQLTWSSQVQTEIVSSHQIRREDRSLATSLPLQSQSEPVNYEDVCDGVAWYKIKVYSRNEDLVATDLKRRIRNLPPIEASSGVRETRFVATWAPKKYMKFPSKKNPNGIRRAVKYGPMRGELVFLECQMDEDVFEVVRAHPFVQDFANLHPFNAQIPLPCSDPDRQAAEDWIWDLDPPKAESINYKREASKSPEEPYLDIAFAVDKLVNGKDDIGFVTVFDETREAADELGEKWKQRQQGQEEKRARRTQRTKQRQDSKRYERQSQHTKQRRDSKQYERREQQTQQRQDSKQYERRFSKGRWKSRNFRKEREMAEMAEDYEVTQWFEGEDSFDDINETSKDEDDPIECEDVEDEAEDQNSQIPVTAPDSTSVTVINGPFSDYKGQVLQESNGHYLINVNVFGEEAMLILKADQFRYNDAEIDEEVQIL